VQAQAATLQIAAKQDVHIQSKSQHIDWAAAKRIVLQTAGGASITIEGGNIIVECPGKITVEASQRSLVGPEQVSFPLPTLPTSKPIPMKLALSLQDIPGAHGVAPAGEPWRLVVVDGEAATVPEFGDVNPAVFNPDHWLETLFSGSVGGNGEIPLSEQQQTELFNRVAMQPGRIFLVSGLRAMPLKPARWSTTPDQTNSKQVLDALNFSADGRGLGEVKQGFLEELAKKDADVQGIKQLKPKTVA
jgi:type VI secretion system secreted protein VgrG